MLRLFSRFIAAVALVSLMTASSVGAQSLCVPTLGTMGRLVEPEDVVIVGPYAMIADTSAGLVIVDVSSPGDPFQVASLWIPNAEHVAVEGERAYVTDREVLHIIDISRPDVPVEIGRFSINGRSAAVAAVNDIVYLAGSWFSPWKGIRIVDVGNPIRPTQIASMDFSWGVSTIEVQGDVLIVDGRYHTLILLDISDPSNPKEIAEHELPGIASFSVSNDLVFVSTGVSLRILDISDPERLTEIGMYEPVDAGFGILHLGVSGGSAVLAGYDEVNFTDRIQIVDVSDPHNPGLLYDEFSHYGNCRALVVSEGLTFFAGWDFSLVIFDISNPLAPEKTGQLDPPVLDEVTCVAGGAYLIGAYSDFVEIAAVPASGDPFEIGVYHAPATIRDFQIAEGYAYAAVPDTGVIVLDTSHPGRLTEIATVESSIPPYRIAVSGTTLYVVSLHSIGIIDIAAPSAAVIRGRYDVVRDGQFYLGRVAESDGLLLVSLVTYGASPRATELWIFDVSDPDTPAPVSVIETPGAVEDIEIVGENAYVAIGSFGLMVLDLEHSDPPAVLDALEFPPGVGYPDHISIRGDLALTALVGGWSGSYPNLGFVDVGNPTHSVFKGGQFEDVHVRSISLMDGRACVLVNGGQLVILDLDRPSTCPGPRQPSGRSIPVDTRKSKDVFVERAVNPPER